MAAITGYASLKTAITDWLANGTLTTFTDNFIQNWEERFYRQPMNFGRWMETSLSSAIASSVLAVPAAYLGLKSAYVSGQNSPPLNRVSLQNMLGRYPRAGTPRVPLFIARDGANFIFGPVPDSTYTIKGTYWAKPVLIRNFASDAAAHWIILNAPDLALYGSLIAAEPFLRNDARTALWRDLYAEALKDYHDLNYEEDSSGSALQEVLA